MIKYEGWHFIGVNGTEVFIQESSLDYLFDKVPVCDVNGNFLFFERRYNGKKPRQMRVGISQLRRDYDQLQSQIDYAGECKPELKLIGDKSASFEIRDIRTHMAWFADNHELFRRRHRLDLILRQANSKVA